MKRLGLCAILVLAFASGALAQSVKVTVTQIKASGSGGGKVTVDPKLSDLARILPKQFKFSNYSFISRSSSDVSISKTAVWTLEGAKYLDATFVSSDGSGPAERVTLTLDVYTKTGSKRKRIVKMTQKIAKDKSTFLGIPSKDSGQRLILAIKVQ